MKENFLSHIDPVTQSASTRSNPEKNHWAIKTQRVGEDFPRVEKVIGNDTIGRNEAYRVFAETDYRTNHISAGITNLTIGETYTHRTQEGEIKSIHEQSEVEIQQAKEEAGKRIVENSTLIKNVSSQDIETFSPNVELKDFIPRIWFDRYQNVWLRSVHGAPFTPEIIESPFLVK